MLGNLVLFFSNLQREEYIKLSWCLKMCIIEENERTHQKRNIHCKFCRWARKLQSNQVFRWFSLGTSTRVNNSVKYHLMVRSICKGHCHRISRSFERHPVKIVAKCVIQNKVVGDHLMRSAVHWWKTGNFELNLSTHCAVIIKTDDFF